MSSDTFSHALVHLLDDDKLMIAKTKDINNFHTPTHRADFLQNCVYYLQKNNKQEKIHIVDLGTLDEIKELLLHNKLHPISAALVDMIELQELYIISVKNIKELESIQLRHVLQFDKYTIYHAHSDEDNIYHDVFIHKLGDYDSLPLALEILNKDISDALVRFLDQDLLDVIGIENIKEYDLAKPETRYEYEPLKCYKGKSGYDATYEDIQILKLGSYDETSRCIDFYNRMTHALVLYKPRNTPEIIPIGLIKEFKNEFPETAQDFNKNKPYSARLAKSTHYCAIQIIELGCEQILKFKVANSKRRYHKQNFSVSEIKECNKTITDVSDNEASLNTPSHNASGSGSETADERDSNDEIISNNKKQKQDEKNKNTMTSSGKLTALQKRKDILLLQQSANESDLDKDTGTTGNRRALSALRNTNNNEEPENPNLRSIKRRNNPNNSNFFNGESSDDDGPIERPAQRLKKKRSSSIQVVTSGKRNSASKNFAKNDNYYETTWSDSSTGSTEEYHMFEKFTERDKNTGMDVKFVHLGYSNRILSSAWKNIKNETFDDAAFIEQLSRALYGKEIFQVYLQKKPYMRVVDGKPRKKVSEDVLKTMKFCLRFWIYSKAKHLLQKRPIEQLVSYANIKHILSQEINYQFNKFSEKHPKRVTYMLSTSFEN